MTYSKSRSMAGARLGFALGSRALIQDLEKLKYSTNPYNVNRLTLKLGQAAVDSDGYFREKAREIMAHPGEDCPGPPGPGLHPAGLPGQLPLRDPPQGGRGGPCTASARRRGF